MEENTSKKVKNIKINKHMILNWNDNVRLIKMRKL
jgi:hypothetical protein